MGARIPRPGYLGPHPDVYCFDLKNIIRWLNCCQIIRKTEVFMCFQQKKKKISNFWLGIGGGGQDTPAGVSWPPPRCILFWSLKSHKLVELLSNNYKNRSVNVFSAKKKMSIFGKQ